ncbi:MAG: hypothetical protein GY804_13235 [Alphaproteobacteria bacterium]|nr:hypothetical protein [Alphaproteobacteria bacterium]
MTNSFKRNITKRPHSGEGVNITKKEFNEGGKSWEEVLTRHLSEAEANLLESMGGGKVTTLHKTPVSTAPTAERLLQLQAGLTTLQQNAGSDSETARVLEESINSATLIISLMTKQKPK